MNSNSILNYIDKAEYLKALYPDGLAFEGSLSEITFHRDGPSITLSFHLSELPGQKPRQWKDPFNRVLVVLQFFDLQQISLRQWGTLNQIKLHFEKVDDLNVISIEGNECELDFKAKWIIFKSISPYLSES
jgi:hypothetical protein